MDLMPIFPLSIIVFPGELVNLHIFEDRYRQLIHEADEFGITFGIATVHNNELHPIASEVRLRQIVKKYADGKMDVTLECIGTLAISNFQERHSHKLYPSADVIKIAFDSAPHDTIYPEIIDLLDKLYHELNVDNVSYGDKTSFRSWQVLHKVGLTQSEEIEFLNYTNERDRAQALLTHLSKFIPQVLLIQDIKTKAAQNGHFKHLESLF